MKAKAVVLSKFFHDFLQENPKQFHAIVLFTVFIPMLLAFYVFQWNLEVFIFIGFGYLSAFAGFHFSDKTAKNPFSFQNFRKHYRLIAENLNDIVIIHRLKDGKNEYVNIAAKTILGYTQKELIGQKTIFIIHPEDQSKINQQLSDLSIWNGSAFKEKVRVRSNVGEFTWMELSVRTLENQFDKQSFAIFTLRDISETIELEQATQQFAHELFMKYMNKEQNKSQQLVAAMPLNI